MAAFQFPDPALETTVVNPITGSTYQWKEPPGKWVVTTKMREVGDIIWEGDNPPDPIGDYKLWYSTDTLELYFYYCDANNVCAWVPTSAPITMLEDLDEGLFEVRQDLIATNVAVRENENRIGRTIEYSDTSPTIYPEIEVTTDIKDVDGITVIGQQTEYFFNELNYKFWYDTSRLELLVLYKDPDDSAYSYVPVSLPLTNLDLDALNTQVQANAYSNNQQSQAIAVLEQLLVQNYEEHNQFRSDIARLEQEIEALKDKLKGPPTTYQRLYRFTRYSNNSGELYGNTANSQALSSAIFSSVDIATQNLPQCSVGDTFQLAYNGKSHTYEITQLKDVSNPGYFGCVFTEGDSDDLVEGARYAVTFSVYE